MLVCVCLFFFSGVPGATRRRRQCASLCTDGERQDCVRGAGSDEAVQHQPKSKGRLHRSQARGNQSMTMPVGYTACWLGVMRDGWVYCVMYWFITIGYLENVLGCSTRHLGMLSINDGGT